MRRVALFIILALAGCRRAPAGVTAPIVDHSRGSLSRIGDLPPAQAAASVDAIYRLLPDRRFLLALRDIELLQRGRTAPVEVDFENDGWRIRCDRREAGRLPAIPSFADGLAMLTQWSASLGSLPKGSLDAKTGEACDRQIAEFRAASLFAAGKALGKPTRASIERASRAAVYLESQTSDSFELGDALAARALALLAMARASRPRFGAEEAALLASALRYDTEARALASSLPPGSAARIATRLDPPRIDAPNPLIARVSIDRAAEEDPDPDAISVAPQAELTAEVAGRSAAQPEPGALLARYEAAIAGHSATTASPLLDSRIVRAYYDANYYTSLDRQLRVFTDHYASEPMSKAFLDHIGKTNQQPGHDVREALAMIVGTTFGSGRGVTSTQLLTMNDIGAAPRADLFITLSLMHGYEASDYDAEIAVLSSLDSRPAQRLQAGLAAMRVTGDPMRRDLYLGSVLTAAPRIVKRGWLGYLANSLGDLQMLRQLAERPDLPGVERAMAASYLAQAGDNATADRVFDVLLRESDDIGVYSSWAGVINRRGDWPAKERVARQWLERHPTAGIDHSNVAASLADALERQGRYSEAWSVVEPDIEIWSANIIGRAVSLLQRLGRVRESDDLGAKLVERYSGAWTRVGYAAVLWRQKRWADAAALFNPKHAAIAYSDWRDHVPDDMAESFEHAPAGDVAAAVGALIDAGVGDDSLDVIPRAFTTRGHPELAFAAAEVLCKRYPLKHDPVSGQAHVEAWRALAAWKGKDAANSWLRERLNDQNAIEAASLLFQSGQDEGVLALADFAQRVRSDEMHVYLAQAMTRLRLPATDARVAALRAELQRKHSGPESLDPVALYLLGMMREKDFLAWPYDASGRTTAAFAVGLKSAAAGDYDRALRYFIAARLGAFRTPPQVWAVEALNRWSSQHMRWRDVAAKRIL